MTTGEEIALEPWHADAVPSAYAWPQHFWVRANLVATVSGQTAGATGTSSDLTTPEDRTILRFIRQDCDALIVGAASIRAEGWHLSPRGHTHIVSRGSSLPWDSCPDTSRVTEWTPYAGEDLNSLTRRLITHLHEAGNTAVLCEGGLATVRALTDEHLLDELCLTVRGSTVADAKRAFRSIVPNAPDWSLTSGMTSDDGATIFSIWRCATKMHS